MKLMSVCKINIIANSTFSWWSSFFKYIKRKLIIVPSKWYKDKTNYLYSGDVHNLMKVFDLIILNDELEIFKQD